MSREIKFRAWDKKQNKMLYGVSTGTIKVWDENAPFLSYEFSYSKNCEFEQSTGLTDKNGKEIYEGDIVNVIGIGIAQVIDSPSGEWMLYYRREPDEINNGFVSVVPKNKPSGLWKTNTTSYIEVIGNIHEPPKDFRPEHLKRMGVSISKGSEE